MFASVLVAIFVLLVVSGLFFRRRKNYPPGPFQWPLIGNLPLLRKLSRALGGQHFAILELSRIYSSDVIALRLGGSNVVTVSGREGVKKILHSEEYDGRPWNEFIKLRNMGNRNGITMTDGPEWQKMRSWVVRSLRSVGFGRREMSDLLSEELQDVLKRIDGGGVRRLKPIFTPAVINVLWTLATGHRFCEGKKLQYFIDLMERRARAFDMAGGVLSAIPWIRHIAPESSGYNLLTTINREVKAFLMETIDSHKANYEPGKNDDLINMFLDEMYSEKETARSFTDDQLVMVMMDLFIAGVNTTATTLDFLFLNMVINQEVQKKVQQEIDEIVGNSRTLDLNDRAKLPYTEAVMTESQRMCTVTPIIGPRRVLQETTLLGYEIPKETTILINLWSLHMNPEYYPEPDKFDPERFIKNGLYVPDENLVLFGKGKRRCPGEVLARSALYLLFAGVLQHFQLLPVPGEEPPKLVRLPGLTISPKQYDVLLSPRKIGAPQS
ncbi:probable cytochrome P450 305a1 isoform X2 [Athalia rosae]|uniref:probable cytochrome P450 305a1 isoform X2 n=1 Tax=Athalia rosae TaxID=37344 RepID=UPI00203331C6|nr:probable cytochrome P450 305a1 isoform X2 [Athalia rosae]